MAKSVIRPLGELQLKILKVLWERSEATVGEVHAGVGDKPSLAYTTIATMLRKMEARGLVRHRMEERKFLYRALVGQEEAAQRMAGRLLEGVFGGSWAGMVAHLLQHREIRAAELDELERLISAKRKEK